jgi:hypothetical protein
MPAILTGVPWRRLALSWEVAWKRKILSFDVDTA